MQQYLKGIMHIIISIDVHILVACKISRQYGAVSLDFLRGSDITLV